MKLNEKTFKVELTEEEVNSLCDMLHESFRVRKQDCADHSKTPEYGTLRNKVIASRNMRNFFATLVNRSYMGEDA